MVVTYSWTVAQHLPPQTHKLSQPVVITPFQRQTGNQRVGPKTIPRPIALLSEEEYEPKEGKKDLERESAKLDS